MTLDEFVEELRHINGGWLMLPNGWIRRRGTMGYHLDCPIEAVLRSRGCRPTWTFADELWLSGDDVEAIMAASDDGDPGWPLRAAILVAVGLVRGERLDAEWPNNDSHSFTSVRSTDRVPEWWWG